MITYIFRKTAPHAFSIEKIFNALYEHLTKSGLHVTRLELPYISTGLGRVLQNVWFVLRCRKSRALHITGDVHYAALLCPFARTIITVHDCVVLQRGTGFKGWVMQTLWFGLPLRMAHAIVVISEKTRQEIVSLMPTVVGKITVIPNFVDPSFNFYQRDFVTVRPRILHVGTTPNKNTRRVIEALRDIPCVLVIVGPLSAALRRALADNRVDFENLVDVDDATIRRLYEDSDIVSFPSTYEGFGMPVLEGQAVGRAVLTSDLDPMRSVAGPEGALLVDPYSIESIRRGFLRLIDDAAVRNQLTVSGLVNARKYSLDAIADRYVQLYRALDVLAG